MDNDVKSAPDASTANSLHSRRGNVKPWQFQPGVSGNPSGRPKSRAISTMFREIFDDPRNIARLKARVMRTLLSARARTFKMSEIYLLREILDRLEGKVPAPIEVSGQFDHRLIIEQARQRVAGLAVSQEPKALPVAPEPPVIDAQPEPVKEPAAPTYRDWARANGLQPEPPPAADPPPRPARARRIVVQ